VKCDLNHTSDKKCAILFSSIQSKQFPEVFHRLWLSSVVSASLPAARRGKRLGSQYALNPHDAQVSFAVRNVNLRNQHGLGVDVVLYAGSLHQPAQDVPKKRFANGDPQ
jgi:hypothetical protein